MNSGHKVMSDLFMSKYFIWVIYSKDDVMFGENAIVLLNVIHCLKVIESWLSSNLLLILTTCIIYFYFFFKFLFKLFLSPSVINDFLIACFLFPPRFRKFLFVLVSLFMYSTPIVQYFGRLCNVDLHIKMGKRKFSE